ITPDDWRAGYDLPLVVNMQPAGEYLSERFHRAGGIPAVLAEMLANGALNGDVMTCTGRTLAENVAGRAVTDRQVIFEWDRPLRQKAGFLVLSGNLFDMAIMKTSVISEDFRARYLSRPGREG
ncbi:dihydroxy-acid dehydratase, partial [Salmonella enterica subsp. enterica serovar Enteritidis]|nr:dihydroxy-acid dehydratase [Salmonella enterica subsp. enterica serovar Enteritidis]